MYKYVEITCFFFFLIDQDELSSIKNQLLQGFSPDDAYPSGPPLFMETPRPCSPLAQIEFPNFDEVKVSKIAPPLVTCQNLHVTNDVIFFPDNGSG